MLNFENGKMIIQLVLWMSIGFCTLERCSAQQPETGYAFDFGAGKAVKGYTQVLPTTLYTPQLGYGFEISAAVKGFGSKDKDSVEADGCFSDNPFYFSVKLPEGNYRVTLTLGDPSGTSDTTVKAELRRLMLEKVQTETGKIKRPTIVVNIRTPAIPGGGRVQLKDRETTSEAWSWDEKLTLEFNGKHPCVCAMEITRVDEIPTLYLLGDSTVCDQPLEPWNSWGQMLTRFFKPDVAVANYAESGESLKSSLGARRIDKVMGLIKPGDWLMVQFGHNDMKDKTPNAVEAYKANLKKLVADIRAKGATPILVTSMERKSGVEKDTLSDYPAKVRQLAKEDKVPLIDLHAVSKILYRAMKSDLDKAFQDGTHHTAYGSYQLARCVIQGIRKNQPELAKHSVDDFTEFDPQRPDPAVQFDIPASPASTPSVPLGN